MEEPMTQALFSALFLANLFALPAAVVFGATVALWPTHQGMPAAKPAAHAPAHA